MRSCTEPWSTPVARASALPASVRARVWVDAAHFFSRSDAQAHAWLWLHRQDGRVQAIRLHRDCAGHDERIAALVDALDAAGGRPGPLALAGGLQAWLLPAAPVVPVPRWQVSWGHPLQRAIRAFAAGLDEDVLHALGDLEVRGAYFGSAANYNRLATLAEPVRSHRLQALARFAPLVAPALLDGFERADLFADGDRDGGAMPPDADAELLDAIDRGRDLIGALARHHRLGRSLVRGPLCSEPWSTGAIPADALYLLDALPATARPSRVHEVESRLEPLRALPVPLRNRSDREWLAQCFRHGWEPAWQRLDALEANLPAAMRDTRDFLNAALDQTPLPELLEGLGREDLACAWLERRGLESLLRASARWHRQPLEELPLPPAPGPVETLERAFDELELVGGRIEELLTRAALVEEGERMHHCVADYWDDCITEGQRIVRLEAPWGERATATFELQTVAGGELRYRLAQLGGVGNARASASMDHLAHQLTDLFNAPELRQRHRRIADAAEAARHHAGHSPRPRRSVRRLDRRSRDELARVLAWCAREGAAAHGGEPLFAGAIAGFRHGEGGRLLGRLRVGDPLGLVREADTPHDRLAVRVDWRGRKLGYVPRADNAAIARLLAAGEALTARVSDLQPAHTWDPVEMEIDRA